MTFESDAYYGTEETAAIDMAMNYGFKWIELNFLDNDPKNDYSLTDFKNIWSAQNGWEIFSSASIACASSMIPWPTDKSKLVATGLAAFGSAATGMVANIEEQYDNLPESLDFSQKMSLIDWNTAFKRAGIQGFIAGVSTGVTVYAVDHPKFRTFASKVKNLSFDKLKSILNKSGFSDETVEAFALRFGVKKTTSKVTRTLEELAPNGKIPKNAEFNKWFDDLNQEELSKVWSNDKLRTQIEVEIRKPGGLHEWCMVCEVEQFKKWGVKMEDIKNFRTSTTKLVGTNPYDGTPFAHSIVNSEGRVVSGPSSKTFHNELQTLIGSSNNMTEFNNGLVKLVAKWKINPNLLPPFIK